ncbi:MAG: NTP transferase domain-containing protein [Anaerolineales bacterium]|nr:NTP transferase domain-containing protein [Anaerolineales bacterium]
MGSNYYAAIMAGGGGTRLWPLSRKKRPKQALKFFGDRTLFQVSVERILPIIDPANILVLTIDDHAQILAKQEEALLQSNFIIEPSPRGTASAIGLAAIYLNHRDPGSVMACLTADHYMANEPAFRELLQAAYDGALDNHLVTLGITPNAPDPTYGYIHKGDEAEKYRGLQTYTVQAFKEKPDAALAREYQQSGEYSWNSGMFVWRTERILEEIQRQMPDLFSGLQEIEKALDTERERETVAAVWNELKSITIDYGVMEGAEDVVVIPADDLGWIDVGDWNRLYNVLEKDDDGNVSDADTTLLLDTRGVIVLQDEQRDSDRLIAALGIDGLVIIDTEDVLLICQREKADQVKRLVDLVNERKLGNYS